MREKEIKLHQELWREALLFSINLGSARARVAVEATRSPGETHIQRLERRLLERVHAPAGCKRRACCNAHAVKRRKAGVRRVSSATSNEGRLQVTYNGNQCF